MTIQEHEFRATVKDLNDRIERLMRKVRSIERRLDDEEEDIIDFYGKAGD